MQNSTHRDLCHVMESSTYSQVVFNDIPQSYPPNTSVTCYYTVTAGLQPNPRDWVGICKVGWSSTRDYHTFVWVEPSLDVVGEEPVRKEVLFREYYLPKDEAEFYQFCYVDSNGQVRGVSAPFSFKTAGQSSVDCSLENDILVITTQDQLERSEREKDDLVKYLDQMKKQNESMKAELEEQQQDIECLKVSKHDLSQKVVMLEKEQQQQNSRGNEELNQSTQSMVELSLTPIQEKYDRAVIKINQLKKERDDLKRENEGQSVQIAQLSPRLKTSEEELHRLKDHIQLLQVDFQSSETEKERELHRRNDLSHEHEELKRENQELRRTLSEREPLQKMADDDSKVPYQTLSGLLQEAQAQLCQEKLVSNNLKTRAEHTKREQEDVMARLESLVDRSNHEAQKISKQEMQLNDLHSTLQEKENKARIAEKENDELTRENQDLRRDIERLRKEMADLQAAPPAVTTSLQHSTPYSRSHDPYTTEEQQEELSDTLLYGNPYENSGSATNPEEELSLECRHCQEKFPGITQDELEQHEQSHKVCPFCTLICDFMEQAVFEDHVYSHQV